MKMKKARQILAVLMTSAMLAGSFNTPVLAAQAGQAEMEEFYQEIQPFESGEAGDSVNIDSMDATVTEAVQDDASAVEEQDEASPADEQEDASAAAGQDDASPADEQDEASAATEQVDEIQQETETLEQTETPEQVDETLQQTETLQETETPELIDETPELIDEAPEQTIVNRALASIAGNPTEADVIIEQNGVVIFKSTPAVESAEALDESAPRFTTLSGALDHVRGKMIAREESIYINVPEEVFAQLDLLEYADIMDHTGDPCGGDYLHSAINYFGANYSTTGGGEYWVEYYFGYKTSADEEAETDAEVERLISSLGLKDGSKSDYDKVKAIHDYIVENVEYDYDTYYGITTDYWETYTGYGAIVMHLAVCQGFSSMFYRLCLEAGIDARMIDSRELGHAWNIVQLDGLYYLMDCTWDENTETDNFFLRGRYDFGEHENSDDQFHEEDFAARYPLSDYRYGFEIEVLGTAPDYTLITADGRTVSTAAENGRAKVLIFFLDRCGRFLYTVNSLSGTEYDGVDFVYVNMVNYLTSDQQNILSQIGDEMPADVPGNYAVCANGGDACAEFETITGIKDPDGWVYSASVFLINPDNEIVYAENAYAGNIGELVEGLLEDADLPDAPEPGEDPFAGFTEIGLCGQNAVWRFYGGDGGAYGKGTLLINGSGKLWDNYYYYTPIGWLTEERGEDRSFSGQNIQAGEVKRVIIEDGITSIGESDFEGFTSLASITFRGPAPAISSGHGVTRNIRIYYPDYEPSWDKVKRSLFPSGCKWISQDADGVHHHKWGSSTVTKKATCTEDGEQEGVCSECGEKATEVIPATGHKWATKYTVDKAATCAEEGVESIHCTVCGSIREGSERTLEKTAHSYGSWQVVTAASCEQSGLRKKVCKSCGDTVTEEIPATGHKWATEYTVDKKPTKTEEGIESIHCTVCDAIKEGSERAIPPRAQEPQDLTIDPAAYTVVMGKTVDVTVTGAKGALTCEAEDPSMATATVSGPKITVKGVKTGTVKLIVKAAETADYEAGEAEFELNVVPGKTTRGDMFNLANNVKVTWLAVPGAKYYKVYRTGVTNPKESLSEPVIVTTGLVGWDKSPGLTNGNAYRYKIVASTTGAGDPSGDSPLSYSKLMYRLKTVVIRSVKNTAPGKVTVKYDRSTSGDSYVLQYCEREDMVGAKTKVVLGANNTSYVIGGLKKGKTYYISIRVRKKVNGIDYYTTFGVAKKIKITQ